ncbi:Uncharacterized protein DBV15_00561 [Temnothorax longispinosus]|uniref:Solute carrier family 22 member 21 n=1 Tax=Temnothorax longispinosus TaxID=300112 RepID=A0A4S2KXP4_9HYME|nr:Uncharacterized protein DBV15_00561 [Temnothorax longispinosus]
MSRYGATMGFGSLRDVKDDSMRLCCSRKDEADSLQPGLENGAAKGPSTGSDVEKFGLYQMAMFAFISIPLMLSAGFTLAYIFTAGEVKYRCLVPECEHAGNATFDDSLWINASAPKTKNGAISGCTRYTVRDDRWDTCTEASFTNVTRDCDSWIYDPDERTILNEWGFTCDANRWKLTLVGTIQNTGQFVGLMFAGYISDSSTSQTLDKKARRIARYREEFRIAARQKCALPRTTGDGTSAYGRRTFLTLSTFLSGVSGLIHSFSVNYWMFLAFEFLDATMAAGIYSAGFILVFAGGAARRRSERILDAMLFTPRLECKYATRVTQIFSRMETVGVKNRVFGSTIICCMFAMGEIFLGLIASWLRSWRTLLRVIYGPGLLAILLPLFIPESVRWLLSKGKHDEVEKIYRKIARMNGLQVTDEAINSFKELSVPKDETKSELVISDERKPIVQVLHSSVILIRLLVCSFCWLTNTFVYYGLSLNSVAFAGDKYINFVLVAVVEIPAYCLAWVLTDRIGRKPTLSGAFLLSGAFCLAIQFVPTGKGIRKKKRRFLRQGWILVSWSRPCCSRNYVGYNGPLCQGARDPGDLSPLCSAGAWSYGPLLLYMAGKLCITMAFGTVYVYTAELFPTTLRHSLLGICSMTGRVGSILSPQTPLLAQIMPSLPLILFGSMGMIAGVLSLIFPETLGTKLPDTVWEAERIGKSNGSRKILGLTTPSRQSSSFTNGGGPEMHPVTPEIRGWPSRDSTKIHGGAQLMGRRGMAKSRRARRNNERDARSQILSVGDLNKHGIFLPVTVYPPPPPLRPSSFVLLPAFIHARARKRRIIISSSKVLVFPRYLEIFRNLLDVHARAIREVLSGNRSDFRWSVVFTIFVYLHHALSVARIAILARC